MVRPEQQEAQSLGAFAGRLTVFSGEAYEREKDKLAWLDKVQPEYTAWRLHNFGVGVVYQPLLGLIEELGELYGAHVEWQNPAELDALEKVRDAIGDSLIYMMDFCRLQGWRMSALWATRQPLAALQGKSYQDGWVFSMRALSHHQLKGEQGIRGGLEVHREKLVDVLRSVLWLLERYHRQQVATVTEEHLLDVLQEVWARVSKRDWKASPDYAHTIAESDGS